MKSAILIAAALVLAGPAAAGTIGQFTQQDDIGAVKQPGSATFDAGTRVYRVTGNGADIWAHTDDFHFVSKKAAGNQAIAATLAWVSEGGDPHRKAGVMM